MENVRFKETGRQVTVHHTSDVLCLCVFVLWPQVYNLRAFYMGKHETPGRVYRKKSCCASKNHYISYINQMQQLFLFFSRSRTRDVPHPALHSESIWKQNLCRVIIWTVYIITELALILWPGNRQLSCKAIVSIDTIGNS